MKGLQVGRTSVRKSGGRPGAVHRHKDAVPLERLLSKFGFGSRSLTRALIDARRVTVNGRPALSWQELVNPHQDRISVDGTRIRPGERLYLLLHKPTGVVTTRSDELARKTVYDLLPPGMPWVFPVGRLDMESSGLLVLTNDTRLGDALTNPASHITKRYLVELDRPIEERILQRFREGDRLRDGSRLRPVTVRRLHGSPHRYEFTLTEGKNRQIRRMCEERGYSILRLHRLAIGSLDLAGLAQGRTRRMTAGEVASLLRRPSRKGR